jgi:hypothetical protein
VSCSLYGHRLSRLDPVAEYRYDTFILLAMAIARAFVFVRVFYVHHVPSRRAWGLAAASC